MKRTLTGCKVYWGDRDLCSPTIALTFDGIPEMPTPYGLLCNDATLDDLQQAVVDMAWDNYIHITLGDVSTHSAADHSTEWAEWNA